MITNAKRGDPMQLLDVFHFAIPFHAILRVSFLGMGPP